ATLADRGLVTNLAPVSECPEVIGRSVHAVIHPGRMRSFLEAILDKAIALANNDTVFLSWIYDKPIPDCLGFAVYRRDQGGQRTPLPAWVGFKGGSNPDWQHKDTSVWPVQKFGWRDFAATRGQT